jgi:hypothetical protein
MAQCITCGSELHPERAEKYDYCMAPQCQQQNLRPLTIVSVGQNKAADEFLILDERTREDLANGRYRDQRRGPVGPPTPAARSRAGAPARTGSGGQPARRPQPRRQPWTASQERLALLYNEQGLRPADIAAKLGLSSHLVTQIILAGRNRGKA